MTEYVDAIEDHIKKAQLRLDKIVFKLDSNLHQKLSEIKLPNNQKQYSLEEIHQIQYQLEEIKQRFQKLQEQREGFMSIYNEKLDELDQRLAKIIK